MARTVVVKDFSKSPPREIGRAWLNEDNTVTVRGFSQERRDHYMTEGIEARTGKLRGQMVKVTDGDDFLNTLMVDWSTGSRVFAVEENAEAATGKSR